MNISLQEANDALEAIETADRQARQVLWYREAAPFLTAWGVVWMACNTATGLWPRFSSLAWGIGTTGGALFTATLMVLQGRRRAVRRAHTPASGVCSRRSMMLLGVTVAGFFAAVFTVLRPLSAPQTNAFISLCFAFAYMAVGAWAGMRLFITGVVTAIAILLGYLFVHEHFFLWMAVFAGGSLLLGGFWFRRI